MPNQESSLNLDLVKHSTDAIAAAGSLTAMVQFVSEIINPLLSAVVLILSAVWTFYRILAIRAEGRKHRKEEELAQDE